MNRRKLLKLVGVIVATLSPIVLAMPVLAAGQFDIYRTSSKAYGVHTNDYFVVPSQDDDDDDDDERKRERTPTPIATSRTPTPKTDKDDRSTPTRRAATYTPTGAPSTTTPTSIPTYAPRTWTPRVPSPTSTPHIATGTPTAAMPIPSPSPANSRGTPGLIVIDGKFDDWIGRENLADKSGDGGRGTDIHYLYWGTNPNGDQLYFMLEPYPDSVRNADDEVEYNIYIDTNNDGEFTSPIDRIVVIDYKPLSHSGLVKVDVKRPNGAKVGNWNGQWGESANSTTSRLELRVSFDSLDISPRQTIRLYTTADDYDRIPDDGDVQVSPIPILDYPMLAILTAGAVALVWWKRGRFVWQKS